MVERKKEYEIWENIDSDTEDKVWLSEESVKKDYVSKKEVTRALIKTAQRQGCTETITMIHESLLPDESHELIRKEYQKMLQEENDGVDKE